MDLGNYVDVSSRLRLALEQWPEVRVQASRPELVTVGDRTFVSVTASVWRTPDDPLPAVATAWEPFPGRTPYTKDSEMMNAETSAVGRALGLAGIGIGLSIASANEIRARLTGDDEPDDRPPAGPPARTVRPGGNPATAGQMTLIGRMRAERGITNPPAEDLTFEQASELIGELKRTPKPA